jgi:hypothetical protein
MAKIDVDRGSTAEEGSGVEGQRTQCGENSHIETKRSGWCRRHYHAHDDLDAEVSGACTRPLA